MCISLSFSTTLRWRVLSGIEAFIRVLFQFDVVFIQMPLRWEKVILFIMIIVVVFIFVLHYGEKQTKKYKRNVLLNVVQIALETCFLNERI